MSPANVYRFFPSKNAIVEAICQRRLAEVEEKAWAVARAKAPAAARMERLFLEILAYHKENFSPSSGSMTSSWSPSSRAGTPSRPQGSDAQRVEADLARRHRRRRVRLRSSRGETAELIFRSLVAFTHPMLLANASRKAWMSRPRPAPSVRFLLRAIYPPLGDPMVSVLSVDCCLKCDESQISSSSHSSRASPFSIVIDPPTDKETRHVDQAGVARRDAPRRCALLAACDERVSGRDDGPRPVQVERVAYAPETASARIRRRGAGAPRDRSRLPRRRQDRRPHRQCRRPRACRRCRRPARSAGPQAAAQSADAELSAATSNLAQAAADALRYREPQVAWLCGDRRFRAQERRQGRGGRPHGAGAALRSISPATNSPMRTSRPTPTASSRQRSPRPARSSPSARRWRGSPIAARRKPSWRCPRPGSTRARQCRRRRAAVVRTRPALCGAFARTVAAGRPGDPHLRGALHHRRSRRQRSRSA